MLQKASFLAFPGFWVTCNTFTLFSSGTSWLLLTPLSPPATARRVAPPYNAPIMSFLCWLPPILSSFSLLNPSGQVFNPTAALSWSLRTSTCEFPQTAPLRLAFFPWLPGLSFLLLFRLSLVALYESSLWMSPCLPEFLAL